MYLFISPCGKTISQWKPDFDRTRLDSKENYWITVDLNWTEQIESELKSFCSIRSGVSIRAIIRKTTTQLLLTCLTCNLRNQKIHVKWNAFSLRLMANTVCQGECNFFALNCPGELSNFTTFTFKYFLEIIISIYGFKRHNFVSENIIFESKTCLHNGHYFERTVGLFHIMRDE